MNALKKFLVVLLAAVALASCAALRKTPEEKAAEREAVAMQVADSIENRSFRIDVDKMYPMKGPSRNVTNFSLSIRGDKIYSHLPYFGVAYSIPYGGGKGLVFDADIKEYIVSHPRVDRTDITLTTDNGEDYFVYAISVFSNGKTDINVSSRNRETINYSGQMDLAL